MYFLILIQVIIAQTTITEYFTMLNASRPVSQQSLSQRESLTTQVKALDSLILQSARQILSTQSNDTYNTMINNDYIEVTTIKATLALFNKLQQSTSSTNSITSVNQSYPNQTYDMVVQEYKLNIYAEYPTFPYTDSPYHVIKTDILNVLDMKLYQPLQYLFDINLTVPFDPYDTANADNLSSFMQQAAYMTCITGNDTYWLNNCQQQVLILKKGKVLIECDCYNISTPITIVNDTKLYYQVETPSNVTYMVIYKSGVLWVIIFISTLWMLFAVSGFYKDHVTESRLQHHRRRTTYQQPKLKIIEQTRKQGTIENVIENLQQESKENSMVIKFEEADDSQKQKRKKQLKFQSVPLPVHQDEESQHENLHTVGEQTNRQLNKQAKSEYQMQESQMSSCSQKSSPSGSPMDEEDDEDDFEDIASQRSPDGQTIKTPSVKRKRKSEMPDTIKGDFDSEQLKSDHKNDPIDQLQKVAHPPIRGKSLTHHQEHTEHHQHHQHGKSVQKVETKIIIIDRNPLPNITIKIFLDIFMREHELFSIFYFYKKKHSRLMRFIINYIKTLMVLAFCGILPVMLQLKLWTNVLFMFPGLLIINGIEQIATICCKQEKWVLKLIGWIVLCLMLAIVIYLFVTEFTHLLPSVHDVWFFTFIINQLIEIIIIEVLLIASRVYIQPWLRTNNEQTNPLYPPLYGLFWDTKVQRIIRKQHSVYTKHQ